MSTFQSLTSGEHFVPATFVAGLFVFIILYRFILPKPLAGIPYNREATRTPFGDLFSLLPELTATGDFTTWIRRQLITHETPIFQVFFLFPFWKPAVVVSDAREVEDILLRRTPKDFDRSHVMRSLLYGVAPEHHVMLTTHDEWKAHRRLLHDLMSPAFLRGIPTESAYQTFSDLVQLWEIKTAMADGLPFSAKEDVHHAALDVIMKFLFGETALQPAIDAKLSHLKGMSGILTDKKSPSGDEEAVSVTPHPARFPETQIDHRIVTTMELCDVLEEFWKTPFRRLKWWWLKATRLRKPMAEKKRFLLEQLGLSMLRMQGRSAEDSSWVRTAVDYMVSKERKFASKERREPDYTSQVMLDEIFGFIVAGHDTTSTTLMWSIKLLAEYPQAQAKLRESLQNAFPQARLESRLPTNAEIQESTNIPYLDAVIEELLRCSPTLPINLRDTVRDTVILGHHIPKGTMVFLHQAAHGIVMPPFPIDESRRSEASRNSKGQGKSKEWSVDDISMFKPERWLKDGKFDAQAGPNLAFSTGIRGCYGRKLAYLEMRTCLILVISRFILEPCPEDLASFDAADGITHKPKKCYVRLRRAY